jgi:hypothetical protein
MADEGRDEIMAGLEAASAARTDISKQLMDLRDTVAQLQAIVMEQSRELTRLRQELGR